MRALAASSGILVGDDEIVACPRSEQLTAVEGDPSVGGARLVCLGPSARATATTCPAGSIRALAGDARRCVRVTSGPRVDVVAWVQLVVGADGGVGTPLLCEALADAGHPAGDVTVVLAFPDNDVSLVHGEVRGATVELVAAADRAMAPLLDALRSLGGTASQAWASAAVRCGAGPSAASRPSAVPENDHEN